MSRARRAALLVAAGLGAAPAAAAELTLWDGAALRTAPDPFAPAAARAADLDAFATLAAPGVGLVVEPAAGATPRVANLIGGAVVRRFAGHVERGLALGAGRVLTLAPQLTLRGAELVADFRLRDERGADLAAFYALARLPAPGLAAFGPETAERLAFQAAALLKGEGPAGDALRAAAALASIEATPDPLPKPAPPPGAAEAPRPASE